MWQTLQFLNHLYGLLLDFLQCVHVPLVLGSLDLNQESQLCLTTVLPDTAEWVQRGRVTSLNLLAMLFLMQLRPLLAFLASRACCCLMFILSPPGSPGSFLQSCFPDSWPSGYIGTWVISPPGVALHNSLYLTSQGQPISPACWGASA